MSSILIVEDEAVLRDVFKTLFTLEKFTVHEATNGQVALDMLAHIKPDAILLDVLMPVMSGIEFLRAAKPAINYPDIKILVLSNLSDPKTLQEIRDLGGHKYLLKASVSPAELAEAVKTLLT